MRHKKIELIRKNLAGGTIFVQVKTAVGSFRKEAKKIKKKSRHGERPETNLCARHTGPIRRCWQRKTTIGRG